MVIKPLKKKVELAYKNLIKAFPLNKNLFLYTNGSGTNEKVDALAITRTVIWNSFLGSTNLSIVYLGELYSIILRTGLASHMEYRCRVFIYIENQASIRAIDNISRKSG